MCTGLFLENKGRGLMAGGYIKLYRKIREHWVWQNAEYLKWWLDILLLANHQPQKIPINGTLKIIDTGEHHTSETKLAKRWFVNRKTVDKFLKMLEKDEMIFIEKSRQNGTTLKVLNYKAYQAFIDSDMDNEKDNGGTTARTSKGHRKDINKNLEEPKEPEEPKKNIHSPAEPNAVSKIISHLNFVCGTNYRPTSKATQKHINARLNEGFSLDDFIAVIDKKHFEWGNDPKMVVFLRPETLFGTKFESYLNQPFTKDLSKGEKAVIDTLNYEFKGDYFDE